MINNKTFQGIAEIILYDKQKDGSLKESFRHTQHNKILISVVQDLLNRVRVFKPEQNVSGNRGNKIAILNNQEAEKFSRTQGNYIATGDPTLIADNYIRTPASDTEPASVVYKNRFLAPTTTRTFYSLGIAKDVTTVRESNGTLLVNLYTYILLNTPITQTTNQVLDINYKVFIDWGNSTSDVNYNGQKDIERLFLGETSTNNNLQIGFEKNQPIWGTIVEDEGTHLYNYWYNNNVSTYIQYFGYLPQVQDTISLTNRYGAVSKPPVGSFTRGWQYGAFLNHDKTLPTYIGRDYFNKTSNLSSVYSHSLGADKPMYDANKLANSSWKPIVEDNNLVKEFPAHYILKVNKAGGLGVGEYKIYKTGHQGWDGNKYTEAIGVPFLQFDLSNYYVYKNDPDTPVSSSFDCYNHRWNYTWSFAPNEHYFVSYVRDKGVSLFKLTSESLEVVKTYYLKDNLSMGSFIEDIDVVVENELIYVATKTGLFKIDVSTDTITEEHTGEICRAVIVGYQGKVFGVFLNQTGTDTNSNPIYAGRISSSDNYLTALPNGNILLPADLPNYTNTWRLFIDKKSTTYNMMLVVGFNTKNKWNTVSNVQAQPLYWYYWRNETEFIKKEAVKVRSNSPEYNSVSDLMCFPSNNSVICDNGIWIYPIEKYFSYNWLQVRYQFDINNGEDLKQDFINTGWNTREGRFYNWAEVGYISQDPELYIFPPNNSTVRYTPQGSRIAIGRFAENSIATYYSHMDSPGELHKAYEGEGNQYKIRVLMEHWAKITETVYHPYHGGGGITGWSEGQREPSAGQWDGNVLGNPDRLAYFVDIDLDLDANTAVIDVKGASETISRYSLRSYSHPDFGSLRTTSDKQIIMFPRVGTVCSLGFYMLSPFRYPDQDLADTFIQAYSWNGTTWVKDNTNTGPGKPLHTQTEPAVNGLSIGWEELSPTDSQDLVLNQYYNFVRTTPENMIPIEEHTPNFSFYYWWSYRRRKVKTYQTIVPSNRIIFVPESPSGTSPDIEWHSLSNSNLLTTAALNGQNIGLVESAATNPPAGTCYYHTTLGRFYFNSADVGKTAFINYTYYLKYDETE